MSVIGAMREVGLSVGVIVHTFAINFDRHLYRVPTAATEPRASIKQRP